jgi:hypothetical protein
MIVSRDRYHELGKGNMFAVRVRVPSLAQGRKLAVDEANTTSCRYHDESADGQLVGGIAIGWGARLPRPPAQARS